MVFLSSVLIGAGRAKSQTTDYGVGIGFEDIFQAVYTAADLDENGKPKRVGVRLGQKSKRTIIGAKRLEDNTVYDVAFTLSDWNDESDAYYRYKDHNADGVLDSYSKIQPDGQEEQFIIRENQILPVKSVIAPGHFKVALDLEEFEVKFEEGEWRKTF